LQQLPQGAFPSSPHYECAQARTSPIPYSYESPSPLRINCNLPPSSPPGPSPLFDLFRRDTDGYVPSSSPVDMDISPYFQPLLSRLHPGGDFASIVGGLGLCQKEITFLVEFSRRCRELSGTEEPDSCMDRESHIRFESLRSVETIIYLIPSLMRAILLRNDANFATIANTIRFLLRAIETFSNLDASVDSKVELPYLVWFA
jgi:hypothetical protein